MTIEKKNEVQHIADLEAKTIQAIFNGQPEIVLTLHAKVEQLFNKGSDYTRSIISTRYILPLSQLLEMNYSWGKQYISLFPKQLQTEYCRQIYSSGI